jgi:WD40 repeat protein
MCKLASFDGPLREIGSIVCERGASAKADVSPEVRAMQFCRTGALLATGGDDATVCVWTIRQGGQQKPFADKPTLSLAANGEVQAIEFSPDNTLLLGMTNALVRVWKISSGQLVGEIVCPTSGVPPQRFRGVGFCADSQHFVTGQMRPSARRVAGESVVTKWRLDTAIREPGKAVKVVNAKRVSSEHHTSLAVSNDGRFVVSATGNGRVGAVEVVGN